MDTRVFSLVVRRKELSVENQTYKKLSYKKKHEIWYETDIFIEILKPAISAGGDSMVVFIQLFFFHCIVPIVFWNCDIVIFIIEVKKKGNNAYCVPCFGDAFHDFCQKKIATHATR